MLSHFESWVKLCATQAVTALERRTTMPRRIVGSRLFLAGCFLFASLDAYGQTLGSIAGGMHDASGAIVPGATISATNSGTNATRTSVTNDAGGYAFPSLPPGIYSVKAEKAGFKTTIRNQIEIQAAECPYRFPI
jgi:hypothetical protein